MIPAIQEIMNRLWLAQFALIPLVLGSWLVLKLLPLRPSSRSFGWLLLLAALLAPALMAPLENPGATLAKVRFQLARTDLDLSTATEASGGWPLSRWETIWVIGSAVCLLHGLRNILAARRYLQRLPHAPQHIRTEIEAIAADVGVSRLRILVTDCVRSPALYCLPKPTLVFPIALWERLSLEARAPIVRHELAHLRRGDPIWHAFAALVVMVLWWNPLVWALRARLHRYGEMAADSWALRRGIESAQDLAGGLIRTQAWVLQAGGRPPGTSMAVVRSRDYRQMEGRLRQMFRRRFFGGALIGAILCGSIALCGVHVGWIVAQAQGGTAEGASPLSFGGFLARALITLEGESRVEDLPLYLERLRQSPDPELRRMAADDLGNLFEQGAPAIGTLLNALEQDPADSVRREAADALFRIGAGGSPAVCERIRTHMRTETSARVKRMMEEILLVPPK